jgi:YbbR domain-containing protein
MTIENKEKVKKKKWIIYIISFLTIAFLLAYINGKKFYEKTGLSPEKIKDIEANKNM